MRLFAVAVLALALATFWIAPRPDVGVAALEHGQITARNDRPFPVLSAAKIIPAAMAIERGGFADLVRRVVVLSDNEASDELTARLGGKQAVEAWLASKGLQPRFATERDMIANPEAFTLRPSELALVLYRLKSPELLSLMAETQTGNDRIRAAYPGAPHKSGTVPGFLSDVGIADGRIIAVMGRNAEPQDLAAAARLAH